MQLAGALRGVDALGGTGRTGRATRLQAVPLRGPGQAIVDDTVDRRSGRAGEGPAERRPHGLAATFLPQVWESLADPAEFLEALRHKAGLPARFWHPRVRLTRYTVEKFTDERTHA